MMNYGFDYLGIIKFTVEISQGRNQGTRRVFLMKKTEVENLLQVYL
jgi:hypothetical protein